MPEGAELIHFFFTDSGQVFNMPVYVLFYWFIKSYG